MFNFLKSKTFWLTVAHIAIVAGGAYASHATGTPAALIVSSVLNALAPSPVGNATNAG